MRSFLKKTMLVLGALLLLLVCAGALSVWYFLSRPTPVTGPVMTSYVPVPDKDRHLKLAGFNISLPKDFLSAEGRGWIASGWQDTDTYSYRFSRSGLTGEVWSGNSTFTGTLAAIWKSDVEAPRDCAEVREQGCSQIKTLRYCSRHAICADAQKIQLLIWKKGMEWATDLNVDIDRQAGESQADLHAFQTLVLSYVY